VTADAAHKIHYHAGSSLLNSPSPAPWLWPPFAVRATSRATRLFHSGLPRYPATHCSRSDCPRL